MHCVRLSPLELSSPSLMHNNNLLYFYIFIYLGFVQRYLCFFFSPLFSKSPIVGFKPKLQIQSVQKMALFFSRLQVYFLKPTILLNPPFSKSPIINPNSYT